MLQIQLMSFVNFDHVKLNAQAGFFRDLDGAVFNLQRLASQALAVLPDPVRVHGGYLAGCGGAHMREHGQRDVKVVVGMRAPGQAPGLAHLRDPNRALHGPEMRVGQRNVH